MPLFLQGYVLHDSELAIVSSLMRPDICSELNSSFSNDFSHQFSPKWEAQLLADGTLKRKRSSKMATSERMTIMIAFHQLNHKYFKKFYIDLV